MGAIIYEKRDHLAYITLNRPEVMNALGPDENEEIVRVWSDFRDDPEAWVAILTGTGDKAQFGCSEVRRGFHHCDGGTVRLPLIVGLGNALKMQLTGEPIGAQEALRIGLVSEVVASGELQSTAESYASMILRNGPLGVRSAKESVLRSLGRVLEDALRFESVLFSTLTRTEDFSEGPRAFAEKRDPVWRGR